MLSENASGGESLRLLQGHRCVAGADHGRRAAGSARFAGAAGDDVERTPRVRSAASRDVALDERRGRTGGQSLRILVIEDHELFAELLTYSLALAGFQNVRRVDPADLHLDAVLAAAERFDPDIVLLDLLLGAAGVATGYIEPMSARSAQVLVLTASEDPTLLAECLEAGTAGLFSKGCPFAELLEGLTDAALGDTVLSPQARAAVLDALKRRRADQLRGLDGFKDLTRREAVVLRALVDGRVVEEIAATDGVAVTTVRAQVRSVLQKLGVNSQLAAVALARRANWPHDR